jgi:predicted GIY-YIG superfamily endonuclease
MKYKNISENLLVYLEPGIYRIKCLKNGKVYIGESNSFLSRLEIHGSQLKNNMPVTNVRDIQLKLDASY